MKQYFYEKHKAFGKPEIWHVIYEASIIKKSANIKNVKIKLDKEIYDYRDNTLEVGWTTIVARDKLKDARGVIRGIFNEDD